MLILQIEFYDDDTVGAPKVSGLRDLRLR